LALTKSAFIVPKAPVSDAAADTVMVPVTGAEDVALLALALVSVLLSELQPAATNARVRVNAGVTVSLRRM
jgi:hypothetical protein